MKNVGEDHLRLQVPICVNDLQFTQDSEHKLITCTTNHLVSLLLVFNSLFQSYKLIVGFHNFFIAKNRLNMFFFAKNRLNRQEDAKKKYNGSNLQSTCECRQ